MRAQRTPRATRQGTMSAPGAEHVEEQMAQAGSISLHVEPPPDPIRRTPPVNARCNGPAPGCNGEREAALAVEDLHEDGRPVSPLQRVSLGELELGLVGARRHKRVHPGGRLVRGIAHRRDQGALRHHGLI